MLTNEGPLEIVTLGWEVMEFEMLGAPRESSPVLPPSDTSRDSTSDNTAGQPLSLGSVPLPLQDMLEERLCLSLQTPIIRGPPRLRKSRTLVSLLSLRRSDRLAVRLREANSTKQAQCVLMHKLGVMVASPDVD